MADKKKRKAAEADVERALAEGDIIGWFNAMNALGVNPLEQVPNAGAGGMSNMVGMPEDMADYGNLDWQEDALDVNYKLNQQLFSPEMTILRAAQFGPGAVDPSAFQPETTYDPLSLSDMANVTYDAQGNPVYSNAEVNPMHARYLSPDYVPGSDLLGDIVREVVLNNGNMDALINQAVTALKDPSNPLHEIAVNQFPRDAWDEASGAFTYNPTGFRMQALDAIEGAYTANQAMNQPQVNLGIDPSTGLPAMVSSQPSALSQQLMDAGFSDPTQPYDPNKWATPEQLAQEAQYTQAYADLLANGLPGGGMQMDKQSAYDADLAAYEAEQASGVPGGAGEYDAYLQWVLENSPEDLTFARGREPTPATSYYLGEPIDGFTPELSDITGINPGTSSYDKDWYDNAPSAAAVNSYLGQMQSGGAGGGGVVAPPPTAPPEGLTAPGEYEQSIAEAAQTWANQMAVYQQQARRNAISQGLLSEGYNPFNDQWRAATGSAANMGIGGPSMYGAVPGVGQPTGQVYGDVSGWQPTAEQQGEHFSFLGGGFMPQREVTGQEWVPGASWERLGL